MGDTMSTDQKPTKELVASILRDVAERVESDDSFEGTITWSFIDETLDARYRIGNQGGGQGGMRIIQLNLPTMDLEDPC